MIKKATTKILDYEEERLALAQELVAEHGADWARQYQPGSLGCHELLDRTSIAANLVEEYIVSSPAGVQNPQWFALARQAADALHELYQQVGAEHLDKTQWH